MTATAVTASPFQSLGRAARRPQSGSVCVSLYKLKQVNPIIR